MEQKTVSFGFSKKKETKTLEKSKISEADGEKSHETEFVSEVDENFSKRKKPKAKEYVIPLIKENKWRSDSIKSGDQIVDTAVLELVEDAKKFQESEKSKGQTDLGLQIPLLMQNKVPEGFETDDKLDVGLRPEEPDEAAYDEIPIDQFGMAMLRGMGFKDGQGIGKNNKSVAPVVAVLRPKGLGLGADRSKAAQLNDAKTGAKDEDEELLTLKKGAYCVLLKGANKDLYGVIEGLDEDNARVMVKLALTGKMVSQSQYAIRLVTEKEYSKYSKYLNKGKSDQYKEKEDERRREKERKREKHHKSKKDKHRERENDSDDSKHSSTDSRKRKYDRLEEDHVVHKGDKQNGHSKPEELWIRPQIRVRLVSKDYKKGKYYNTKLDVIDVISPNNCVCRTDDGKVLEGISQSDLETVIPKQDNAHVLIVTGKQKGQLAQIMKKDKSKYRATLQLLRDRDEVIKLDFDSICEYTGNIDDEYDY